MMRRQLLLVLFMMVCHCGVLRAGETLPPRPTHYFNDYAHFVQPQTANDLDQKLAQFERDTSNQIVVAIYPHMQSDSAIEDYTVRVAQNWQVGQKDKKNGAVLFVFSDDHKMYLQVGYGLEGALPDALCKRIIEDEIKPHFKQNDPDGGLRSGVAAIIAATRGEYHGTGRTVGSAVPDHASAQVTWLCIIIFILIVVVLVASPNRRGTAYNSGGYSSTGWQIGGTILNILLNIALSGGSSGGRSSSGGGGGGGGFSSGGGSFGGGGAGGSW
jgi:uncharacterized protein